MLRLCCVVVVTISSFVKIWLIFPKISCDFENFIQIKFGGVRGKSQSALGPSQWLGRHIGPPGVGVVYDVAQCHKCLNQSQCCSYSGQSLWGRGEKLGNYLKFSDV